MNQMTLVGNVGANPLFNEVKSSQILSFAVATDESYRDKEGKLIQACEWHSVIVFGKLAETLKDKVKKGVKVFVAGKMKYRSVEKEGIRKQFAEVNAYTVHVLS